MYLFFCTENGLADPIAADRLAILLSGCATLRLAFLNTCQGAQAGTDSSLCRPGAAADPAGYAGSDRHAGADL